MAVNTKHLNDLMKEISKELQQLQGDIMETTEMFKQRRETVDKHCGQCRDLFKPWPSKVVQLYSPNSQTDEKLDETDELLDKLRSFPDCTREELQAANKVPSGVAVVRPEKPNCGSSIPENEKEEQELAMLDDILAKAQHARDIQNKMSKPSKKSHSAKLKSSNLPTSQVKETKPKPKVSYLVPKRPPSAKSTYSASYTKPTVKTKSLGTGTKKTSSTSRTTVTSQQKLRKHPEQGKTTEVKSHETKKSTCENLSKNPTQRLTENKVSSKPQPSGGTNFEPNTKTTTDTKFLISEKGSTLTMPTEFREICKEHKKLLRRIQKARTFTQRQSEDQFVKKVEELFCPKLHSLPSLLELGEDMYRLEKEYKELLSFMKVKVPGMQCARDTGQVDESSDWLEDWGTVMSKFKQLDQEAQILKENLDFLSKHCPLPEHKSVVFGEQGENLDGKLPSSFTGTKTDVDGYFIYHNMKELRTLLKLSYDYKIMKYQLDLRKMLGETILPLLQQLPTNHKSFVPLCRAVYSILCCEGKTFPTVVKDCSPED